MVFRRLRASDVEAGKGPHPAASPYDRWIGQALEVTAFELYQVDLPPEGETVLHDHTADGVEDVYLILAGGGLLVVDEVRTSVSPGDYVSVDQQHRRKLVAGEAGLRLVAICAPARS